MRHGVSSVCKASSRSVNSLQQCTRAYSAATDGQPKIAVLGGGITGLASAYYLTKQIPRASVTIFESSPRIGGWLSSNRVEVAGGSVLFEGGPRSLRTTGNGILAAKLIEELDLKKDTIFTINTSAAASHRYIYHPDHLVRMPHPHFGFVDNISTMLREPVFSGVLSGLLREPFVPVRSRSDQDESIGDFLGRRFGRSLVDNIVSAVLHGIHAGDVYQLSTRSLMSRFWRDEIKKDGWKTGIYGNLVNSMINGPEMSLKDVMFMQHVPFLKDTELAQTLRTTSVYTFRDGIGQLVDNLARNLILSEKVQVRTDTAVQSIVLSESGTSVVVKPIDAEHGSFDHVVSALSPTHLGSLMPEHLPRIPAVTVMTVNLYYRQAELLPPGPTADRLGFGYLIPRAIPFEQNPERALGVVFDNAYAPPRIGHAEEPTVYQDTLAQPGTKVTVMLGGHWWNDWPAYPDEQEGLSMAKAVLKRHLNIDQEPEAFQVNLQKDCIPQYNVGHEDRLKTIHNKIWRTYKGKVRVAGNWIYGVGVNDCLRSAYQVVNQIESGKDGTGLDHIGQEEYLRVKLKPRE